MYHYLLRTSSRLSHSDRVWGLDAQVDNIACGLRTASFHAYTLFIRNALFLLFRCQAIFNFRSALLYLIIVCNQGDPNISIKIHDSFHIEDFHLISTKQS
ncbi:unnamed protein product [Albugo candida]|uniref:Uncharacterized protein n=1 Tax=Albugo candida TaxID=65357 RepID=A0A024GI34_9STRA|nr:unnamed protein product [Albugo candida]|eukprot:CCI45993.1 unnamed protein product [Albugo candida]